METTSTELFVVWLIVAVTLFLVARSIWRRCRQKQGGCGSGGCSGCAVSAFKQRQASCDHKSR